MKVKLSDAFDLQMGKTPPRNDRECWGDGHKWISISDIGNAGKYIDTTKEEITDIGVSKSGIKVVPKGTVIMSFKLSIGKTAITAEDMYTNEAIMAFIKKEKYEIDTDYLYHMCKGIDWFEGTNKAVLGLTLNKATMSEKIIEIPPMEVQLHVVSVLDKMDELISLRKEQLAKLDQLVKSRFIELFGDPVKNNMGWESKPLNDVCDGIGDGLHGTPEYDEDGEYPFINGNNLIDGEIIITPATKMVAAKTYEKHFIDISTNAILISINGTLGKLAFYNGEKVMLGKSACYCNLKQDINKVFVYGVMKSDAFAEFLENSSTKSTIKNVGLKAMREFRLILPPMELQEQFTTFVEQTDKSKLAIQQSLDKLELLKKSLMQEYFG